MIARLIPLLILLLFRFYDLGLRPTHHDEAVNGWFVDGILGRGYYVYDPQNYHGPLFFYILTLFEKIFGRSIEALRIPSVIFGSLISFTPFLFKKWLGKTASWIAAFAFALSPALVFYSRYSIHETFFVFFCILFFFFWLRIKEEGFTNKNILGFGLTFGAIASLKENFVLYGAGLGLAEGFLWWFDGKSPVTFNRKFWIGLVSAFAIGAAFIAIAFTGFFQDPHGIQNFFKAFQIWFQTGEKGNGHQKPFTYWLEIMGSLEWVALLGLILTPFIVLKKKLPAPLRLMSLTCALLWLIYSVVAYKTPWCMLSFYWGLILVASYWMAQVLKGKYQTWFVAPLIAGAIYSAYQAYDVSYVNVDADGHFYIYGQTYREMMAPVNELVALAKANPAMKDKFRIQIISSFTWPFPYVLGEFKQVGYYSETNTPIILDADEVIMDRKYELMFANRLSGNYKRTETKSRQWAEPVVFFRKLP